MRYDVEHKAKSRERILHSAAAQFRSKGTETVRVADVMEAVGMTHGGFYKHFADKDELLHEAISTALVSLSEQIALLTAGMPRPAALKKVIDFYLSEEHMLHPDLGCAVAALGSEMARMEPVIKRAVSKALDIYTDRLSFLMPGETDAQRQSAFLVLFPSMAGCLMTARAYTSKQRQRQLLASGRAFFTRAFCSDETEVFMDVLK